MSAPRDRLPLLLGHFGGNNAGDEAILDGTCQLLAASGVGAVRIVARGENYSPATTAPVEVAPVAPSVRAVWSALRRSSCVVLCGGTHFEDGFPRTRRIRHYRYLARYLAVLTAARVLRRPVVAVGQGFGPLDHPTGRMLTRALLTIVSAGTVRDDASYELARRLGARPDRWRRTFDTAVAVDDRLHAVERPRRALAVAPVRWADPSVWDACVSVIAAAWPALELDRIDVVACRGGAREDDLAAAASLATGLRDVGPCRTTVFAGDVDALVDTLADARIVFCGRYHALILAVLAGAVPIVLPAHPKLIAAAEMLGLPGELVVRSSDVDALAAALRAGLDFDARKLRAALDDLRDTLTWDQAVLAHAAGSS